MPRSRATRAPRRSRLTLVGYGPREETGGAAGAGAGANGGGTQQRRHRRGCAGLVQHPARRRAGARARADAEHSAAPQRVLAKPPVRKLAKTLGVDLATVEPTGPNGTVSRDDVESAADDSRVASSDASGQPYATTRASGDHSRERETRIPIKGVRKHTAAAMVVGVHRAARHRVHHLRRHRDDGAARPGRRAARVPRGQGRRRCCSSPRPSSSPRARRPRSTPPGTKPPARSS